MDSEPKKQSKVKYNCVISNHSIAYNYESGLILHMEQSEKLGNVS